MRRNWIDNLRWVVVVLVVVYHVFYVFNGVGVFGGIGPFSEKQPQDIIMYTMYPWFMAILFLLAGMSSRYSLEKRSGKEFFSSRTRKLLVPSTIGLFVIQWMVGYLNMRGAGAEWGTEMPAPVKYVIYSLTGIGPLWFAQELWLLSAMLLLIRKGDKNGKAFAWCSKFFSTSKGLAILVVVGTLLFWGCSHLDRYDMPLLGLYRFSFYPIPFFLGYFILASDEVTGKIAENWKICLLVFITLVVIYVVRWYPQTYTSAECLTDITTNIFAWIGSLCLIGIFKANFNGEKGRLANYMTSRSFGIYVLHYLPVILCAIILKQKLNLPAIAVYPIMLVAVPAVSLALYEILSRIPFIRWAAFGIKKKKK